MHFLEWLWASGHMVDIVLILLSIEIAAIILYRERFGGGISAEQCLAFMVPGFYLLLAVRCAITGTGVGMIALCVVGALLATVLSLRVFGPEVPPARSRR